MRHKTEEISIDRYAITLIFTDDIVEETYHRVKQILLPSSFGNAREKIQHSQEQLAALNKQYDDILSLAELYDSANIEARKMVVNSMIKRVRVFRGYHLEVEFNFNLDQFIHGLDFEMDN